METYETEPSAEELNKIISFLGYGNPSESVWFIGFEEGLGNMTSTDTMWNLKSRGQFKPIMDLHDAHSGMRQNGERIDISKKPPTTQVWRWMAKLMRARASHKDWSDKHESIEYVSKCLGRTAGQTFLTELSPIPTRRNLDNVWASWFAQRIDDLPKRMGQRQAELRNLLSEASPKKIYCYGLSKKSQYSALLDVDFEPVCPGVFASSDFKCILLPFFGNGCMSKKLVQALLERNII